MCHDPITSSSTIYRCGSTHLDALNSTFGGSQGHIWLKFSIISMQMCPCWPWGTDSVFSYVPDISVAQKANGRCVLFWLYAQVLDDGNVMSLSAYRAEKWNPIKWTLKRHTSHHVTGCNLSCCSKNNPHLLQWNKNEYRLSKNHQISCDSNRLKEKSNVETKNCC